MSIKRLVQSATSSSFAASREDLKGFVPPAKVPEPATSYGVVMLALGAFWWQRKLKNIAV
jgi:hypothetical protein